MGGDIDDTMRAFRNIKRNIRERGIEQVASEWAQADRLPTILAIREMAETVNISLFRLDDWIIQGWINGARQEILAGQSPEAVRERIAALVVDYGQDMERGKQG